tara:strand:+ start:205 stop:432 length:228 start_codon:yes stop_codon:yes gene_type:complete
MVKLFYMSSEQLLHKQQSGTPESAEFVKRKIPGRVDINNLLFKVREEQKKQKKETIVFFGLISSVVVITGIIASL